MFERPLIDQRYHTAYAVMGVDASSCCGCLQLARTPSDAHCIFLLSLYACEFLYNCLIRLDSL